MKKIFIVFIALTFTSGVFLVSQSCAQTVSEVSKIRTILKEKEEGQSINFLEVLEQVRNEGPNGNASSIPFSSDSNESTGLLPPLDGKDPFLKNPIYVYSGQPDLSKLYPRLVYGRCMDRDCSTFQDSSSMLPFGWGQHIRRGTDGLPVISWQGDRSVGIFGLRILKCYDADCYNYSINVIEPSFHNVASHALDIGHDGLPFLIYTDISNDHSQSNVYLYKCSNIDCTRGIKHTILTETIFPEFFSQAEFNVIFKPDGNLIFALLKNTVAEGPKPFVVSCLDSLCSSKTTSMISDSDGWAINVSMVIGGDGLPAITNNNLLEGSLYFTHCLDISCNTWSPIQNIAGAEGGRTMVTLVGPEGFARVNYDGWNYPHLSPYFLTCRNFECSDHSKVMLSDLGDSYAIYGYDRLPLIAIAERTAFGPPANKFIKCDNSICSSFSESLRQTTDYHIGSFELDL